MMFYTSHMIVENGIYWIMRRTSVNSMGHEPTRGRNNDQYFESDSILGLWSLAVG